MHKCSVKVAGDVNDKSALRAGKIILSERQLMHKCSVKVAGAGQR
jgi:hypothetical protein